MSRKRHKPEEIVTKLRQVDVLVSAGRRAVGIAGKQSKQAARPLRLPKKPKDNPRRRYQELMEDLHFGSPGDANLAEFRHAAMAQARAMSRATTTAMTLPTSGGSNWIQLGPLAIVKGQTIGNSARVIVTGRVTDIAVDPVDPQILYLATARGGVWKTIDGGITWTAMSDHAESLQIGALAIAPSHRKTLYAGTGEGNVYFYVRDYPLDSVNVSYGGSGILRSADSGQTWVTQASATFTGSCFYRIKVHPTDLNTVFAASNLGLHRTIDSGVTWVQMTNGLPPISPAIIAATDVVFDPMTPTTAYVAFWGSGVYKTTNATAVNPSWTQLTGGLPTNIRRIALAVSPTSPQTVYAFFGADTPQDDKLAGLFISSDGGISWTAVPLPAMATYESYTLNVAVDISTPDIVYLSAVSLYKVTRTSPTTWNVKNIGANIHADHHAFAGDPTNPLVIYAGTDGGIYKSSDQGVTWDDSINEGICITQFEFIDQHPTSDAVVIGGTQDNGTEQFRNSPAFYHSADGDGGSCGIDQSDPRNVLHTWYGQTPHRSMQGGNFGTFVPVYFGIVGNPLFYPPMVYDQTNSSNIALGTHRINIDDNQGLNGWQTGVPPSGFGLARFSAISFVNSTLIYGGTAAGKVHRFEKIGFAWTVTPVMGEISAPPLPARWIWDIATLPGDPNTVILVMGGFGTPHVWQGAVTVSGTNATAIWTDISGTPPFRLPDIPVNSLCIDPNIPNTYYIGSDIGVFRTADAGATWQPFNDGLPNTAVYDLKLHTPIRLLRAATHGRGLWERKLDVSNMPDVDIYVRDHLMDTARILPSPSPVTATYDDPLQHVAVGDSLWPWMCADIKIDAPAGPTLAYQMPVAAVDYLAFETMLSHRDPQRGVLDRVYVQIHNRGIQAATNLTVKLLYAAPSPGLPDLPSDFWTGFPDSWTPNPWFPVGPAKTIASMSPTRPEILEWDWVPPATANNHTCMLLVVDCASDPIPAANKVFDIWDLVTREKRVGWKNLHLIDALGLLHWSQIHISGAIKASDLLQFSRAPKDWSVGVLLPKAIAAKAKSDGLKAAKLTKVQLDALQRFARDAALVVARPGERAKSARNIKLYDPTDFQLCAPDKIATIGNVPETRGFDLLLAFAPRNRAARRQFTLIQRSGERVVGGNTFVLTPKQ